MKLPGNDTAGHVSLKGKACGIEKVDDVELKERQIHHSRESSQNSCSDSSSNGEHRHKKRKREKSKGKSQKSKDSSENNCSDSSIVEKREHKKRKREKSRRKHRRRHSISSVTSSSSSSSDSESERRVKKRKKEKKSRRRKHKKEKKRKKKKSKDKKEKKKRKKSKKEKINRIGAVDQNAYGTFGIIREADFYKLQAEFESWLRDIKDIEMGSLPKFEQKDKFSEFMEDFNTATMPSEKYYNINKWHEKQAAIVHESRLRELERRQKLKQNKLNTGNNSMIERSKRIQEEDRKAAERAEAERKKLREAYVMKNGMNSEKAKAMMEHKRLQSLLQLAYKSGNQKEVKRIKKTLY